MKYKSLIAITLIAVLSGCTESNAPGAGGRAQVKIMALDDGTKCAVLVGHTKGAISCNWKE